MLHRIAVPFIRPFFPNGHDAVENGLVDGLYPLNECKKVFFVAKQFSHPLPFPHQPHDAVFEVGHIVVGFISLYCMFRRPQAPTIEFHSTSVATRQSRCEHHSALAAPSVRCLHLPERPCGR